MDIRNESMELFRLGRWAESEEAFRKAHRFYCLAVSLNPDEPVFIRATARLAARLGRHDEAETLFREAIDCARLRSGCASALTTSLICALRDLRARRRLRHVCRTLRLVPLTEAAP